jgi:hypothetical protein
MNYFKATAGALAIMMAAGMIADFDVSARDDDIYVTVWSVGDGPDGRLRSHVAALLPPTVSENHVIVLRAAA